MALDLETLPKLINPYTHSLHPEWGKNTGRNTNSGKFSGSFIGWFDQLTLTFGKHNQTQHTQILSDLGVATKEIKFLDTKTGAYKTEWFYLDSIDTETTNYHKGYYNQMTITLTAIAKRSDM